ncbi:MAG: TfoX/Sxy family protein [Bacilli bacterium]|nr:TfoX/Sxy family protein [Bacilli bacterium]
MASSQEYLLYVLDLLRLVPGITYKKMMGEYLLYKDGVLFGGVYDDRFLVKKKESIASYGFAEVIPYPSAKPMYLVDLENPSSIAEALEKMFID